ncbi:Type III secretion ATP synthase HrcN [compost metagenome]
MSQVTEREHQLSARTLKQLYAEYQSIKPLIPLGGYVAGADPMADKAVNLAPAITRFLQQEVQDAALLDKTISDLNVLAKAG